MATQCVGMIPGNFHLKISSLLLNKQELPWIGSEVKPSQGEPIGRVPVELQGLLVEFKQIQIKLADQNNQVPQQDRDVLEKRSKLMLLLWRALLDEQLPREHQGKSMQVGENWLIYLRQ